MLKIKISIFNKSGLFLAIHKLALNFLLLHLGYPDQYLHIDLQ